MFLSKQIYAVHIPETRVQTGGVRRSQDFDKASIHRVPKNQEFGIQRIPWVSSRKLWSDAELGSQIEKISGGRKCVLSVFLLFLHCCFRCR